MKGVKSTVFRVVLLITILMALAISGYFILKFIRRNEPCALINKNNICWANTVMQIISSSEKLKNFLIEQKQHQDEKIKAFAEFFIKYDKKFEFDATNFYKTIFCPLGFELKGNQEDGHKALKKLTNLLTTTFPKENLFPNDPFNDFLLNEITKDDLKRLKVEKNSHLDTIQAFFAQTQGSPQNFILRVKENRNETSPIVPLTISYKNKSYKLKSLLVDTQCPRMKTPGADWHSYCVLEKKGQWFVANDNNIEVIIPNKINSTSIENPDANYALYTIDE